MNKYLFILLFFLPLCTKAQVIVTAVGTGVAGYEGDGLPAIDAKLYHPYGVGLDDSGNLYICDDGNRCVRKVSPAYGGIITTIAGNGTPGYSGDHGLGTNAQLYGVWDVAIDRHGNVYLPDAGNNCIRKVTPADTITTIAGTGIAGYNGDSIPAATAQLNNPTSIAVDKAGNLYIADTRNYRLRKIDTAGIIHTIAGTGIAGYSPDGSKADTSNILLPVAIRIDDTGNIYFTDSMRVRKIDIAGIITTIAGNGVVGSSGDSGLAVLAETEPDAIALDMLGNVFIAEPSYARIRKVDTAGIIHTIAGNGMLGYYGDNGAPLLAKLCFPYGVAISNSGDVYIGDVCNERVRLITEHPNKVHDISGNENYSIVVYPDPCHTDCTVQVNAVTSEWVGIIVNNAMGMEVGRLRIPTNEPAIIRPDWPPGVYIVSAVVGQQKLYQKLIIQ